MNCVIKDSVHLLDCSDLSIRGTIVLRVSSALSVHYIASIPTLQL